MRRPTDEETVGRTPDTALKVSDTRLKLSRIRENTSESPVTCSIVKRAGRRDHTPWPYLLKIERQSDDMCAGDMPLWRSTWRPRIPTHTHTHDNKTNLHNDSTHTNKHQQIDSLHTQQQQQNTHGKATMIHAHTHTQKLHIATQRCHTCTHKTK